MDFGSSVLVSVILLYLGFGAKHPYDNNKLKDCCIYLAAMLAFIVICSCAIYWGYNYAL